MVKEDVDIIKKEFNKFPKWFFETLAILHDVTPSKAKKDFLKRLESSCK